MDALLLRRPKLPTFFFLLKFIIFMIHFNVLNLSIMNDFSRTVRLKMNLLDLHYRDTDALSI